MENDYHLSARTEDLGAVSYEFVLATRTKGAQGIRSSHYGYIAVVPMSNGSIMDTLIKAGLNEAGLSCDKQTLLGTEYPAKNETLDNIDAAFICQWALEAYSSIEELRHGLEGINFIASAHEGFSDGHWVFRDSHGQGLVVEFLHGRMLAYQDNNDKGVTGFGIMTNEPPYPWQLQGIKHLQWKQSLARSAVAIPGSWYPDDRFQRIYLVKSGMPKPGSYKEAVMQTVHVMNTITVPMGQQIGTDSGKGEGVDDRTHWGIIYDHVNRILYWRSMENQNLQRIRLSDADITAGGHAQYLHMSGKELPWFHDAAKALNGSHAMTSKSQLVL
eukprot:TRINITY_DN82000_c0_g1_i1.p1 TRINITY_DN82000_c0_g1~~TRINITY_DN82000_c0_g1_i1.p1  ORF type:complete len:363 (-),score=36.49 TRINITY_DN82000_c0_g1_i1:5-991(-)